MTQHRGPCEDLRAVSTLGHRSEPPGSMVPWHSCSHPAAGIRQTLVLGTCAPLTWCPSCLLSLKGRQEPRPFKRPAGPGLETGRVCLRLTAGSASGAEGSSMGRGWNLVSPFALWGLSCPDELGWGAAGTREEPPLLRDSPMSQ